MKILTLSATPKNEIIHQAVEILKAGGLVVYPTETVYGLGVDATNQEAVDKLLRFKARREGKPLSIAVGDKNMAKKYVKLNDQASNLYDQFLPGPITVVSSGKHQVAKGVESEFGTLGVRIPNYPLILEIVKALGRPITATSANASGKPRPYSIDTIFRYTSAKQQALIDLVLDAGILPKNPPSTVIDTTLSTPLIMRGELIKTQNSSRRLANQNLKIRNSKLETRNLNFITNNPEETKQLAGKLLLKYWQDLQQNGLVFALSGALGAGKTTFTQGLAQYLNIREPVISPTYTYMTEYDWQKNEAKGKLHHLDLWRVDDPELVERLEIKKLIKPYNLVVIEWWEQGKQKLKEIIKAKNARLVSVMLEDLGDEKRKVMVK